MVSKSDFIKAKASDFFIERMEDTLRRHPKRVVMAEGEDARVILSAARFYERGLGVCILLGDREKIDTKASELGVNPKCFKCLRPEDSDDFELYCRRYKRIRAYQGKRVSNVEEAVAKAQTYAAIMTQYGSVDAMLAGNLVEPSSVLRSALRVIKPLMPHGSASSFSLFVDGRGELSGGEHLLAMADTGVMPKPNISQLAQVASDLADVTKHLIGKTPRLAVIGYRNRSSSNTSARDAKISAVCAFAEQIFAKNMQDARIDGEMQLDVALFPQNAKRKMPASKVAGRANALLFPDLVSAHAVVKALQKFSGMNYYGQIILGLAKPVAQISRSASSENVYGVTLLAAYLAIEFHKLYPDYNPDYS